jgi:hypothetical protein
MKLAGELRPGCVRSICLRGASIEAASTGFLMQLYGIARAGMVCGTAGEAISGEMFLLTLGCASTMF